MNDNSHLSLGHLDGQTAIAMVEASPDALVMVGDTGMIELVNRQACHLFGFANPAEAVGQPLEMLLPDRFAQTHRAHRTRYGATPSVRTMGSGMELRAKHLDGSELPVEISLSPLQIDGKLHVIAAVRDITERLRTEQQLLDNSRRLGAAFNDGPVAMTITEISPSADRIVVEANEAMAALLGYELDDLVGMSVVDFTHPDDLEADNAATDAQVEGAAPSFEGRKRYLRADGSTVWVELHVSVLTTDGDRITAIGHSTDISAQVRAEEERAKDQAILTSLTDVQSALLAETSLPNVLSLICRCARELVGADITIFARPGADAPDDQPRYLSPIAFSARDDSVPPAQRTIDDRIRTVLAGEQIRIVGSQQSGDDTSLLVPVYSLDGIDGVLVLDRSTADRPFTDGDLDTATKFAQAAAAALQLDDARRGHQRAELLEDRERIGRDMHDNVIGRLFATGMALQSTTSRIADRETQDRLVAAVREIDDTIKEIRSSIYGLRSHAGWAKGITGEILAVAVQHQTALGFEPRVNISGPVDELPNEVVDHALAVLREALSNAGKYASATSVDIAVRAEPGALCVVIADNGRGFTDPPTGSTSAQRHSGNGLANMASRASALGGTLSVESAHDDGTTITWSVPVSVTGR